MHVKTAKFIINILGNLVDPIACKTREPSSMDPFALDTIQVTLQDNSLVPATINHTKAMPDSYIASISSKND